MQNSKLANWDNPDDEDFGKIPENLPEMLSYNVLVKPMAINEKTKGGIILSDRSQDALNHLMSVGLVVAMGPECFTIVDSRGHVVLDEEGNPKKNPSRYNVGDWVSWPRMAGTNVTFQGHKFKVISDDQPIMKVNDPNDLSSNYQFAQ